MLVVCRSRARVPEPFPYVPSAWGGQTFLHALRSAVLGVAVSPLGAKGLLGNSKPLKDREAVSQTETGLHSNQASPSNSFWSLRCRGEPTSVSYFFQPKTVHCATASLRNAGGPLVSHASLFLQIPGITRSLRGAADLFRTDGSVCLSLLFSLSLTNKEGCGLQEQQDASAEKGLAAGEPQLGDQGGARAAPDHAGRCSISDAS